MATCLRCGAELPEAARFCSSCAAPVEEQPAQEERKLATVLFGDLVGSTELAGGEDPERTRALLNRFYEAMAEEIEAAGGSVEKFAGDAVMAAFGAPSAQEDHAERALHAALSMRRRLEELFGDRLALRIGVNTGEVVVGRPREGSSFVSGDAVNVAARLEQAAAPGEILVGDRTAAAARGAFEFGDAATKEAKGKPDGIGCRRLVRALSLMRPRGVSGLGRAFVGRESELELLLATYRRAVGGAEPHLVTIMGDAGVGKTTLMRELWQRLEGESAPPLRRTGRCLSYGQGITYWPLGEILKEHFGILESDSIETARRRLGGRDALGLTVGLAGDEDLHPLAARNRLHDAWVEFLEELVGEQPAVVLIEDVYWAEDPLLDLVERIVRDVRGPLLLVSTARPELLDRRPAWGGGRRNASLVWLEPLPEEEAVRMLEQLVAAKLPEHVREVVIDGAEGNPFFVEELVATLIDRGVLEREDDRWAVRDLPGDFSVPDSVSAVLAARIDLLGPTEKAALQAAAVIGRTFWTGPVCELLEGAEPDFGLLEERDFIRRRSGSTMAGESEYAIKHALTREVAYGSLPKARRAKLHAAFADWLERLGEERDELAPLLAHHYAEAVKPEDADLAWPGDEDELGRVRARAVAWLRRAAHVAVGSYAIDEAVALLERAVELEPDAQERAAIWRELGRANALKFDGEAFWTAMERSIEICFDRRVCAETYADLAFQTTVRSGMWRRRPDRELVSSWIERARELTDPDTPARVKALVAQVYWEEEGQEEAAREAVAVAERVGDPELRSYAWDARGIVAFRNFDYESDVHWQMRRFELINEIHDPDHLHDIHQSTIAPCAAIGRFKEAQRLAQANDELTRRLTAHHRLHGVSGLLEVDELTGEWERIVELEPRIDEAVAENLATPCIRNPRSLLVLALAHEQLGHGEDAVRHEERADELGYEGYDEILAAPRVGLALVRGDLALVERLLAEPIWPRRQTWFSLPARAVRLDGLAALGDRDGVEREATPLLKPRTYLEPFALRALGLARGDEALIERALERFEAMRLDWYAGQTRGMVAAKDR